MSVHVPGRCPDVNKSSVPLTLRRCTAEARLAELALLDLNKGRDPVLLISEVNFGPASRAAESSVPHNGETGR